MVRKIRIIFKLYPKMQAEYFGDQETEDEEPAFDVGPQPQDQFK